jgi:hypothetical protein
MLLLWPPGGAWTLKKRRDIERKLRINKDCIPNWWMFFGKIRHYEWEFFIFVLK